MRTEEVGIKLAEALPRHRVSLDEHLRGKDVLRTALLRFVDVAPVCRSKTDLAEHLFGLVDQVDGVPRVMCALTRVPGGKNILGESALNPTPSRTG